MKKSLIPFKYQVSVYDDPRRSGFPDDVFYFDNLESVRDFLSCNDLFALVSELDIKTFEYTKIVGSTRVVYEDSVNE